MSDLYPEEQRVAADYARSPEGKNAGGLVAMGMLGELAQRGATPQVREAAATLMAEGGVGAEMIPGTPEATAALTGPATGAAGGIGMPFLTESPSPAVAPDPDSLVPAAFPDAPEVVMSAPTPSWDELDLGDDDEPTQARAEADEEFDEDEDFGDPDALRRKLAKERKRREHAERERAKALQGKWVEEAVHVFGGFVSDEELAGIEATSRRDYLRQAKAIAERNRAVLQRFGVQPGQAPAPAAPAAPPASETEAQMRERIRAEERARLEQAWGRPMVSPGAPAIAPADPDRQKAVAAARRTGNLEKLMRANLFGRG